MSDAPLSFPCICARLRRTTRRVSQIYDRHLEPHGLTISQFGVMAQVRHGDAPSIGQLAERMVMDPTTLTRAIKPLERRGLLALAPDPSDRRTRRLALTETGRALLRAARPGWEAAQAELRTALGDEASLALVTQLDGTLASLGSTVAIAP
jgi:DNA-binding MarR family transcriptional regulator